ncbi:MAG: response regulator, partial [Calditrichia bacterium]
LVVEDDFDLRYLIKKILVLNGFQVLTAGSAEKALSEFSRHIFDIHAVILDLSLPDRDGAYIAKELLKVDPEIPIIVTTGFEDQQRRSEIKEIGIRHYLIKPFDIMQLIRIISEII